MSSYFPTSSAGLSYVDKTKILQDLKPKIRDQIEEACGYNSHYSFGSVIERYVLMMTSSSMHNSLDEARQAIFRKTNTKRIADSMNKRIKNATESLETIEMEIQERMQQLTELLALKEAEKLVIENAKIQIEYTKETNFSKIDDNILSLITSRDIESPHIDFSNLSQDLWRTDVNADVWKTILYDADRRFNHNSNDDCQYNNNLYINISRTCRRFRDHIKERFVNISLRVHKSGGERCSCGTCNRVKNLFIPVPTDISKSKFLETLLYVPFTSSGRTIIHGFVRSGNMKNLKKLSQKISGLNINVGTLLHNWSPIHNHIFSSCNWSGMNLDDFLDMGAKLDSEMMVCDSTGITTDIYDFLIKIFKGGIPKYDYPSKLFNILKSGYTPTVKSEIDYCMMSSLSVYDYFSLNEIYKICSTPNTEVNFNIY